MRRTMNKRVDFHSHILPGLDDGSRSVEESLQMLRLEAEQGITHVVATPHFYANHDTPDRFLQRRAAAWERLQAAMAAEPELPEVILGAEVYYFPGISDSQALSRLAIGQKGFMMLEMPAMPWTENMYQEIGLIYEKQGITPIIAHVDRYLRPLEGNRVLKRLEELPVLIQANGSFFLRPLAAPMAMKLMRAGRIHLLGSDCHDLMRRMPNLGPARDRIQKRLGCTALERIRVCENTVLSENCSRV